MSLRESRNVHQKRLIDWVNLPFCDSSLSFLLTETRCAATGFEGESPGARTPNLRINGLPDHTEENRISSDCSGFRRTQPLPEPPTPAKKGSPPRA